jgi:hypothetical protein
MLRREVAAASQRLLCREASFAEEQREPFDFAQDKQAPALHMSLRRRSRMRNRRQRAKD